MPAAPASLPPKAPPAAPALRLLALIPVAVNLELAASPAFQSHPGLRTVAVASGLLGGALMWRALDRNRALLGGMFVVVGLSHLYLLGSVAATDHLTRINYLGGSVDLAGALWNGFVFAAVGLAVLCRGAQPIGTPGD